MLSEFQFFTDGINLRWMNKNLLREILKTNKSSRNSLLAQQTINIKHE